MNYLIKTNKLRTIADEALNHARFHPKGDKEVLKLFELVRPEGGTSAVGSLGEVGRRALPALEMTVQNMFATLVSTAKNNPNATR